MVDVKVFFFLEPPIEGHNEVNKLPVAPLVRRGEVTRKLGARGWVIIFGIHHLVVEPFDYNSIIA
jgi:hypothetical protein